MRKAILVFLQLLCACGGEGEAEMAVRQQMLDPDATQFRDVRQCSGDRTVSSGEANGKNSFGAYTGFKPFFYSAGVVAYADDYNFAAMMARCYSGVKGAVPTEAVLPQEALPKASPSVTAPKLQPSAETSGNVDFTDPETEGRSRSNVAMQDQCWADYCPCDTSDPDYGGADVPLCRSLKMGVAVSDEMVAAAAGLRDARKQIREFDH